AHHNLGANYSQSQNSASQSSQSYQAPQQAAPQAPVQQQAAASVEIVREVQPTREEATALHGSAEDKSDFDRFMSDRNAYQSSSANEEESQSASTQSQQPAAQQPPSRLIQQIRDAANRYENTGARPGQPTGNVSPTNSSPVNEGQNGRAKSIAEKLGFINFDEDEFDTPSYLRKEDKSQEQRTTNREISKNFDL
ncbi:MAG: hypothetical protein H7336_12760, partial [Bacteriovorax sp.]|nr:hypothetical protein [Bacteriovorax sp.]